MATSTGHTTEGRDWRRRRRRGGGSGNMQFYVLIEQNSLCF